MEDIIPRFTKTVTSQLPNLLRRWTRLLLWMPSKCLEMAWLSSFNWTMAILIFQIHRQKHSRDMINKQLDFRCIKSNSNSWFPRISPRLTQNNAKNSVFAQNKFQFWSILRLRISKWHARFDSRASGGQGPQESLTYIKRVSHP